jgi:hypothetical protein
MDCVICIEPVRMPRLISLERNCNCDFVAHDMCLGNWLNNTQTCLICREPTYIAQQSIFDVLFWTTFELFVIACGMALFFIMIVYITT